MDKGSLVSFLVKGSLRAAVVEGPEGKTQFRVTDQLGNSHLVHPRDIGFDSSACKITGKLPATTGLEAFLQRAEALRAQADLASAWEILSEETGPHPLESLADLLFGDCTAEAAWILYHSLGQDTVYFKKKADAWETRTAAQVEEAKKQALAQASKSRAQEEFKARLQDRLKNPGADLAADDWRKVESLKKFALWGEEAPEKSSAHEILGLLGAPKTDSAAFQTLVELHVWSVHENLDLLRSQVPLVFSDDLLAAAQALAAQKPADSALRVDLTGHTVLTIDDASTTEIDDGLSVTTENGKTTYWVHIADPDALLKPGHPLDDEARRRGTTLYLPTGKITMFPDVLAEGPFSLRAGVDTAALSFGLTLAADGSLEAWKLVPSLIRPTHRLSYQQADEWLAAGTLPDLTALAEGADRRFDWRGTRGAIQINLPEIDIRVDGPDGETIHIIEVQDTRSRKVVSEWMVAAGEACARFAQEHGIAVPYRFQPAPDLPEPAALEVLPAGPVRNFAVLKSMNRSGSSLEPKPHAGLGLDLYVQATSPIRRYADLLTHRQMKSFLETGKPLLSADDVSALTPDLDAAGSGSAKLERQADRYWLVEYFRRNKGQVWTGLMLDWQRPDDKLAAVLIEEVGYRVNFKLVKDHPLGAKLRLKVASADPRKDLLTFNEV